MRTRAQLLNQEDRIVLSLVAINLLRRRPGAGEARSPRG